MPTLPELPEACSEKLRLLVGAFNKIASDEEKELSADDHLNRIILLQKIVSQLELEPPSPLLDEWLTNTEKQGLERQLQRYGIHRDASPFLKSFEFANAIMAVKEVEPLETDVSLPVLTQEEQTLFQKPEAEQSAEAYVELARKKMHYFSQPEMQEKIILHQQILALVYSKLEAIRGEVEQKFSNFSTKDLSSNNNQNFLFHVAGLETPLVIRVEDRTNTDSESALRQHEVSGFFSDDYATIKVPMLHDGKAEYLPVVVSEFAEDADLQSYASKQKGKDPEQILDNALAKFEQLNTFTNQLMDAGYYHPDIKLTNFLISGERIFVSDRKTLINERNPKVSDISSSPAYGAPEYQQCINTFGTGYNSKAYTTRLDMPQYMSFQIGMALKEYLLLAMKDKISDKYSEEDVNLFAANWLPLSQLFDAPTDRLKNISVLVQELTREESGDRLTVDKFQRLMTQVDLSEEVFLAKVEEEHPLSKCSEQARLVSDIQTTLKSSDDKLQTFVDWLKEHKEDIDFNEPRIKGALQTLYRESGILEKLQQYGESIQQELRKADLAKMSGIKTFLSYLGAGMPKRTKIAELSKDVVLPEGVIRDCLDLLSDIGLSVVDEVDPSILDILKQIDELDKDEVKITRSLGRVSQLLDASTSVSDSTVVVADTVVVSPQQPTGTTVESSSTMVDMRDRQPPGNGNLDAAIAAIQRENEEEERAGLGTEDISHAGDIAETIQRGDKVHEDESSVSPRRG